MPVQRFGDWGVALDIVNTMERDFRAAATSAAVEEGHFLRKMIVEGIRNGAPGGKAFLPLAPTTLAVRAVTGFKGTKPLIRKGDLRNAIVVKHENGVVFIGVLRSARGRRGQSIANIADLMENGSRPIVIRLTPRARRFLFMALRRAGLAGAGGHHDKRGTGIAIVQIPPRPFFAPVFEQYASNREQVARRFLGRIAKRLGGRLGLV